VDLLRVVFEEGHCLLPRQKSLQEYETMLDEDVRKIAGRVISVHETTLSTPPGSLVPATHSHSSSASSVMSLNMENLCGTFKLNLDNVPSAGGLLRRGATRVGRYVRNKPFVGTHHLFHTIHGRIAYLVDRKKWSFKGARSLEDLIAFVRDLTEDSESPIYPVVTMLSVTLRTGSPLVIDPAHSLMQRVIERLYSGVVQMQSRVDDTNNLFFMEVSNWKELINVVGKAKGLSVDVDQDALHVRAYLAANESAPTTSIGYTRKGVFFVRITFPRGCICFVPGSSGVFQGVSSSGPPDYDGAPGPAPVCVGGVEPFVQIVVRFVVLLLVKMKAVGGVC